MKGSRRKHRIGTAFTKEICFLANVRIGKRLQVLPRAIYTAAVTFGKELLVSDVRYSAWANQRVLDACSVLTAAEIERDLRISHSSILRTLGHIYDGDRLWLEDSSEAGLGTEVMVQLPGEIEPSLARWKILRHVLEHSTLHRGQIIGMIRMLGQAPPAINRMDFCLEGEPALS